MANNTLSMLLIPERQFISTNFKLLNLNLILDLKSLDAEKANKKGKLLKL